MEKIRILTAIICIGLLCNILSVATVSASEGTTVTITIYKIGEEDSIEGLLEGGADWSYKIWVYDGNEWQESSWVDCPDNNDNFLEDIQYDYTVYTSQINVRFALKERDLTGSELADISADIGGGTGYFDGTDYLTGARYEGTWDLVNDELSGDETNLVDLSGEMYYWTSGSNDGSEGTDEKDASLWFNIEDVYEKPVAYAGNDQTTDAGDKVNFDGSPSAGSVDIELYQWDFETDGVWDIVGDSTSYTYNDAGTYTVTLKITDSLGETSTDSLVVTVNSKPTSAFVYTPDSQPTTLDTLQFTDTSTVFGGTLTGWYWTFGDGVTSTERNPTHQFSDGGTYSVSLKVTANDGEVDTKTKSITIIELATITGTVEDSDDNPISGASIKLYNTGTTTILETASTNSNGEYTISGIGTGTYDIEASKASYNNHKKTNIVIYSGENTQDFMLTVPSSSENGNGNNGNNNGTPGFEIVIILCAISLIIFWKQKKRDEE